MQTQWMKKATNGFTARQQAEGRFLTPLWFFYVFEMKKVERDDCSFENIDLSPRLQQQQ